MPAPSDLLGAHSAPPGGSRYQLAWDLWSVPPPTGITSGAMEVRLRVAVLDAPGGTITVKDASFFRYAWPTPRVQRTVPQDDATGVFLDSQILVDFAHDMDPTTITSANLTLSEAGVGTITTTTVTYLSASRQAKITVAGDLPASNTLTLTVTTSVKNAFGLSLPSSHAVTFATGTLKALADDDGDGLLTVEELAYGTLTNDADTDDDGWDDDYELFVSGTSPSEADTDGDGTVDGSDATPLGTPTLPLAVADVAPVTVLSPTTEYPSAVLAKRPLLADGYT